MLFRWSLCCQYCSWLLSLIFLSSFLFRLRVVVSTYPRNLQCWRVLMLLFFLDTYCLSMSSVECKALWIVIIFLVLWSICWSFSLVHFKNDREYLTKGIAQVCIPLERFLLQSLVSRNFLVRMGYSFFFHLHLFDDVRFQYSQILVIFLFSDSFLIWQFYSFRYFSFFQLVSISMANFSMSNSIPISWLYILIVGIRVSYSFSIFANRLISSIYIRWLINLCLWSVVKVHFLSILLRDIISIKNCNGENASLRKIPLWIFIFVKLFPPTINSSFQFLL